MRDCTSTALQSWAVTLLPEMLVVTMSAATASASGGERFTIEPTAAVYNLFNFVNYDTSPTTRLQGLLNGATGTISGTTNSLTDRGAERAGQGSSLFSLGTARQLEFGMKITF